MSDLVVCLENLSRERSERAAAEEALATTVQQLQNDLEQQLSENQTHLQAVKEAVSAKQSISSQLEQALEVGP